MNEPLAQRLRPKTLADVCGQQHLLAPGLSLIHISLLKLPKGTEHFMSDLHGENEAFVHILNSASGVIREKVDAVLGDAMPEAARAELATLIYYPTEKLPQLKARCTTERCV